MFEPVDVVLAGPGNAPSGGRPTPLERAAESDFDGFWQRQASTVYRRCLALLNGRREEAHEALSRVALSAYRHHSERRDVLANERGWALRLAANACIDLHRERQRKKEVSFEEAAPSAPQADRAALLSTYDPEALLLRVELLHHIRASIDALPARLKLTAQLRLLEEAPYSEIASRLGIAEANVRKRIQEARQLLRRALATYLGGDPPSQRAPTAVLKQ